MISSGAMFAIIGGSLLAVMILIIIFVSISNHQNPIPPPLPSCDEVDPTLIIPNDHPSCATAPYLYYIGNISNYDFVVSPLPIPAENVCASLCTHFVDGKCQEGVTQYETCLNTITSNTCTGPLPLAKKDGVIYYAIFAGNTLCS